MSLPSNPNFPHGIPGVKIGATTFVVNQCEISTTTTRQIVRPNFYGDCADTLTRTSSQPILGTMELQRASVNTPEPAAGTRFYYNLKKDDTIQFYEVTDVRFNASTDSADFFEIGIKEVLLETQSNDLEDGTSRIGHISFFGQNWTPFGATHSVYNHSVDLDGIGAAFSGIYSTKSVANSGFHVEATIPQDGNTYIVTFSYFNPSGNGNIIFVTTNTMIQPPLLLAGSLAVKDTWETVTFSAIRDAGGSGNPGIRTTASTSEVVYFDSPSVARL